MIKISSIGSVLAGIRESRGMTHEQIAAMLGLRADVLVKNEMGKVKPAKSTVDAFKKMDLTDKERAAIESLYVEKSCYDIACKDCASHDGEIRPCGRIGDRDEYCVHINTCLNVFVMRWGAEEKSHCPPNCTRRERDTQEFDMDKLVRRAKR